MQVKRLFEELGAEAIVTTLSCLVAGDAAAVVEARKGSSAKAKAAALSDEVRGRRGLSGWRRCG